MGIISDQVEFSIDNFVNEFAGGARSNIFVWFPQIKDSKGDTIPNTKERMYLVKATNFPSTTVEEHVINYPGLDFKVGGKKTFEDWSITLYLDSKGKMRYELEEWMNGIHEVRDGKNVHHYFDNYKSDQTFLMLKNNGKFTDPLLEIKLYGAWPKTIGSIALDYSSSEFAEFELTFSYQYHVIKEPIESPSGTFDLESFLGTVTDKIKGLIGL